MGVDAVDAVPLQSFANAAAQVDDLCDVPALRAEIVRLRVMGDAIVDALPKCDHCDAPATKAIKRGGGRWCDEHGLYDAEYPRAAPIRAWQAERAKR